MARASRSSKKQPAFDPSELKDLIFSPAVGTGVGSHLLVTNEHFPAPTDEQQNENADTKQSPVVTTVDRLNVTQSTGLRSAAAILERLPSVREFGSDAHQYLSAVVTSDLPTGYEMATVRGHREQEPMPFSVDVSTVVTQVPSTVGVTEPPTVDEWDRNDAAVGPVEHIAAQQQQALQEKQSERGREETSEPYSITSTVGQDNAGISDPFVVESTEILRNKSTQSVLLWITEQGDLVPQSRVRRIRLAQDVINSAEESVYDTLWTAKTSQTTDRESSRVVQAGYDYLVKCTRLSKKTIQRIVAKLIDKNFIAIERPADIYQRSSTVYRVFSYKAVLDHHLQKGRSYVAKMGPGFSYVSPIEDPRLTKRSSPTQSEPTPEPAPGHLSTVVKCKTPTVEDKAMSTMVNQTTETVAQSHQSTVVRETTTFIGKDDLGKTTSSSSNIYQALSSYGAVDDDMLNQFVKNCKQQTQDCTEEEIVHFIQEKGSLILVRHSRIYNPIGFLLTAVPKCLSGEAFRLYREEQTKRRESEAAYELKCQAELDEWRREQEARLDDPKVSEQDKEFIRECLGIRKETHQ